MKLMQQSDNDQTLDSNRSRFWKTSNIWILAGSLLLILISLTITYHFRPFNSDDVAWQNALLTWKPFHGQTLFWSPDTWILKIPIYVLVSHFFSDTRRAIFVESAIFAVANFCIFYYSALYFIQKFNKKVGALDLLPFLWLGSFGYTFTTMFLNPNLRSIEIGFSFLLFVLIAKIYDKKLFLLKSVFPIISSLIVCIVIGLLIYNDPYFLYFSVLPVVIYSAVLFTTKQSARKPALIIGAGFIFSMISWKLISKLGSDAGISILPQSVQFVTFDKLFPQIGSTIQAILTTFGADFTGRAVINLITFGMLANLALLIFAVSVIYRQIKLPRNLMLEGTNLWKTFIAITPVFVVVVYTLSSIALPGTYRYLVLLPFFAVILLSTSTPSLPVILRRLIYTLLIFAVFFNLGTSIANVKDSTLASGYSAGNIANSQNFDLLNVLRGHGLTKGYGQYWEANINSYLSKGGINLLPVTCSNDTQTNRFNWMLNSERFNLKAQRSFYVYDSSALMTTPQCTINSLDNQFGQPAEIFTSDNKTVLVYNYDIVTRLGPGIPE